MKNTKITAFLMVLCLLFTLLVACDFSESGSLEDEEINNEENNGSNNEDNGEGEIKGEDGKDEITFTQKVVVDNDECMIKITGIDSDNFWGYALKVQLENKSEDKTYMFSVESASVNGVECDPFFATEVASGKKANDKITFSENTLEENGIDKFTDIELNFRVYDSDDWMADDIVETSVHIYPYGEEKAADFVRESQATDTVIVDNEYLTVIVTGYEQDDVWGYTANLFIINKSGNNIMCSIDDASVNGFMIDPFYATTVRAGKCKFSSISWSYSNLEENDIATVEEIEFLFRGYDADYWLEKDFVNQNVKLKP